MNIYSPYYIDLEKISSDEGSLDVLSKKISLLGTGLTQVLFSAETPFVLEAISLTFSLSENQATALTRVVRDVMLGDIFIGDMASQLSQKAQIETPIAKQITNKLLTELFGPAIEDIKNMQREKFADRLSGGARPSASTAPAGPAKPAPQPVQAQRPAAVAPVQPLPQKPAPYIPRLDPMTPHKPPRPDVPAPNVVNLRDKK